MVEMKEEYKKAKELRVILKDGILEGSNKNMVRTLNKRYHLDTNLDDAESVEVNY